MANIACSDYIEGIPGFVPARPKRTNPDALLNRWGNFVYAMDLSPEPEDDDLGNAGGAWSLWDLPVSFATQIDDDRGDDLIVVAIKDRVYVLDWTRFRDEFDWNAFKPIYRMLRFGPLPHANSVVEGSAQSAEQSYQISATKRFREFYWAMKQPPTDPASAFRLTVSEWDNEDAVTRSTTGALAARNRVNISINAQAFVVMLEHAADEPFSPYQWRVSWDDLKRPVRLNGPRTQ